MIATARNCLNMNDTTRQTAHAFLTVYKALPEQVQAEVRQLIMQDAGQEPAPVLPDRKRLTDFLRANPVSIPADFKFDREEANER